MEYNKNIQMISLFQLQDDFYLHRFYRFLIRMYTRIKSDKNETPTMILDLIHKPSLVNIFDHKNMIIIRHKVKAMRIT